MEHAHLGGLDFENRESGQLRAQHGGQSEWQHDGDLHEHCGTDHRLRGRRSKRLCYLHDDGRQRHDVMRQYYRPCGRHVPARYGHSQQCPHSDVGCQHIRDHKRQCHGQWVHCGCGDLLLFQCHGGFDHERHHICVKQCRLRQHLGESDHRNGNNDQSRLPVISL